MKGSILLVLLVLFSVKQAPAQELNCQVSVIANNKLDITSVELEILDQLKNTIYEFMNNTKWTKDNFEVEERINCQLQLQIEDIPAPGVYKGMLQVQCSRPTFNSSYNTMLFNFQDDKITFEYARNAILAYAPNQFRDNLTSVLAFYAYYILGLDYDSFGLKDGEKYFTEAQNIVVNAQSSAYPGWGPNETGNKNNRYWLVDNALHQLFEPLRECFYEYHRMGMDRLYDNKAEARNAIYDALNKLVKVVATRPGSINLLTFVQAKVTELKNLYYDADLQEKNKLVALLKRLDPANASKFDEILG